jgi:hypothetical protein
MVWFSQGGGHERVALYTMDLPCWLGQGGGLKCVPALLERGSGVSNSVSPNPSTLASLPCSPLWSMGVAGAGVFPLPVLSIWLSCCSTAGVSACASPHASSLLPCNVLRSEGDVAIIGGGSSAGAGEEAVGVVRPGAVLFTRGSVGGIRGGGVAGVVAAAVAAAATSPVDPLFDSSTASVTTSVSACSAHSLSRSSMRVAVGSTWGVCAVTVLFASRPA